MQAIRTKYLGATNSRGARVKAYAWAGSVTLPWDHAIDAEANHRNAAHKLANNLQWGASTWHSGGFEDGSYVFVQQSAKPAFHIS